MKKGYQGVDMPSSVLSGADVFSRREIALFTKKAIAKIEIAKPITAKSSELKSIISGKTSELEFHHIAKGVGVKPAGVILTKEEHMGLTGLQGQLGQIKYIKGQEKVLELLGERTTALPKGHEKQIVKFLSEPGTKADVSRILKEAASQVKDPTQFRGNPLQPKGKVENLINIVSGEQDAISDIEAFGDVLKKGAVYGKPYDTRTVKPTIYGTKKKFEFHGMPYQTQSKIISLRAIQSKPSLAQATNLIPTDVEKIMRGAEFAPAPFGARLPKEPIYVYMEDLKAAVYKFSAGDKPGAVELGKIAAGRMKQIPNIDWGKGIREYIPPLETKITGTKEDASSSVFTKFVESPDTKTGAGLGLGTTKVQPKEERKDSVKLATSSPYRGSAIKSVYGSSYKQSPVVKQENVFDSIFGSTKSTTSTFKQHSPKSPSVSSANSLYSPKSPASIE